MGRAPLKAVIKTWEKSRRRRFAYMYMQTAAAVIAHCYLNNGNKSFNVRVITQTSRLWPRKFPPHVFDL